MKYLIFVLVSSVLLLNSFCFKRKPLLCYSTDEVRVFLLDDSFFIAKIEYEGTIVNVKGNYLKRGYDVYFVKPASIVKVDSIVLSEGKKSDTALVKLINKTAFRGMVAGVSTGSKTRLWRTDDGCMIVPKRLYKDSLRVSVSDNSYFILRDTARDYRPTMISKVFYVGKSDSVTVFYSYDSTMFFNRFIPDSTTL